MAGREYLLKIDIDDGKEALCEKLNLLRIMNVELHKYMDIKHVRVYVSSTGGYHVEAIVSTTLDKLILLVLQSALDDPIRVIYNVAKMLEGVKYNLLFCEKTLRNQESGEVYRHRREPIFRGTLFDALKTFCDEY